MFEEEVKSPKVLILFGHPAYQKSRNQRAMKEAIVESGMARVRDLYSLYPDGLIDVEAEQRELVWADIIVLQHPFFWYSTPAIFKDYADLVLEYGFAYGENGNKLQRKFWAHAITTGGPEESYQPLGYNRFSIRQLLAPWEQTAHLCGCRFIDPFVHHGAHQVDTDRVRSLKQNYLKFVERLKEQFLTEKRT